MSEIEDLFGFLGKKHQQEQRRIIDRGKELATEHWIWFEPRLRDMYQQGFIHGYKHGYSDATRIGVQPKSRKEASAT